MDWAGAILGKSRGFVGWAGLVIKIKNNFFINWTDLNERE